MDTDEDLCVAAFRVYLNGFSPTVVGEGGGLVPQPADVYFDVGGARLMVRLCGGSGAKHVEGVIVVHVEEVTALDLALRGMSAATANAPQEVRLVVECHGAVVDPGAGPGGGTLQHVLRNSLHLLCIQASISESSTVAAIADAVLAHTPCRPVWPWFTSQHRSVLPSWVGAVATSPPAHFLTRRLYTPATRSLTQFLVAVIAFLSVAWSLWRLYHVVEFFQDMVDFVLHRLRPVIQILEAVGLRFLGIFTEPLFELYTQLQPLTVVVKHTFAPLVNLMTPLWTAGSVVVATLGHMFSTALYSVATVAFAAARSLWRPVSSIISQAIVPIAQRVSCVRCSKLGLRVYHFLRDTAQFRFDPERARLAALFKSFTNGVRVGCRALCKCAASCRRHKATVALGSNALLLAVEGSDLSSEDSPSDTSADGAPHRRRRPRSRSPFPATRRRSARFLNRTPT